MASHDDWAGSGSVDPAFAELFRAEDAPAVPAPPGDAEPLPPVHEERDVEVPQASAQAPTTSAEPSGPSVDTGRLFRSQGVVGSSTAVLALTSDHGGRLRTLSRSDVPAPAPSATSHGPVSPPAADEFDDVGPAPSADASEAAPTPAPAGRTRRDRAQTGLRAGAVYLLVIGVTLVVAVINALIASGNVGWPTGLALLIVSVYCALKVRRDDDLVAIITPPIAFALVAITAAQLFLGSAQHSLLNRAVVAFFTLANNWGWIIGSTVIALIIVLVRRRR